MEDDEGIFKDKLQEERTGHFTEKITETGNTTMTAAD